MFLLGANTLAHLLSAMKKKGLEHRLQVGKLNTLAYWVHSYVSKKTKCCEFYHQEPY